MSDIIWKRSSILAQYAETIKLSEIEPIVAERLLALKRPHWEKLHHCLSKLPLGCQLLERNGNLEIDFQSPVVRIGRSGDLTAEEHQHLAETIRALIPWRKGPFELFGHEIDAEWRSDWKWERLVPHLPKLSGKRIADIGCNNGYYLFRMLGEALQAGEAPECIIGMDPSESFYFAFELMQRFVQRPELSYLPLGVEQITMFPEFFEVIFCLGVIYHQRDPLTMLQNIRSAMQPGGTAIIESQAIPGEDPVALFAPDRYAKARNTYFIPTAACLLAWMQRAGFKDVKLVSEVAVTAEEQRRTELAPYESFEDFVDQAHPLKTVEGFDAPLRIVAVGRS